MSLGGVTAILITVNGPKHLSRKHRKQALPPYHDNLETRENRRLAAMIATRRTGNHSIQANEFQFLRRSDPP